MAISYTNTGNLKSYTFSTAWDLSTKNSQNQYDVVNDCTATTCGNVNSLYVEGINFGDNGTKLYVTPYNSGNIFVYNTATAYSANGMSLDYVWDMIDGIVISGLCFKPDGTKMFFVGQDGASIALRQGTLATPWDLNTLTIDPVEYTMSVPAQLAGQLYIDDTGEMLFMLYRNNAIVYKIALI